MDNKPLNPDIIQHMRTLVLLNKKHRTEKPIPAPAWLTERMETLQRMPPPTLREMDTHVKASAAIRKRLNARQPV
jgi:hypothetical protein